MINLLKESLKTHTLKVNRPILVKATFNHHYEIANQFKKGRQIELMLNYLLFKTFYPITVFRPDILINKQICKIRYNSDENHLSKVSKSDPEFDLHKTLTQHFIKVYMNMYRKGSDFEIDFDDEIFNNQFTSILDILTPSKRLIIKPIINEFSPDLILDNLIIDIKTDKDSKGHNKYIQQTLLYYYLYNHALSSEIQFSKKINLGQTLFLEKVDSIGIYYWKYNRLIKFKISELIDDEIDLKIKSMLNDVVCGNSVIKGLFKREFA